MPPPDRTARSIFCNALDLPAAERAAYLAAACAGDAPLRAEVEDLLGAHERATGFLAPNVNPTQTAAPRTAASDPPTVDATGDWTGSGTPPARGPGGEAAGAVIAGRYKLLEPIGTGGMGSVWMAQQVEPVRRLVAVKLIKPGMDSRIVLARFDAERQALAMMDHPNIARVFDAGTMPDGRPFFVMELVKGVPITQFCDERKFTPRQRLELFVSVCRALEHAHQKGVIHRDIKPSNVLVALYDDKPVPKVIDFGVAKAAGEPLTDRTLHTGFGMIVGTLAYMAPEQAAFNNLDVDTRADVYGLGALLYELLAGSAPFTGAAFHRAALIEALRAVREDEPPRPSTRVSSSTEQPMVAAARGMEPGRLAWLLRADLDWVVMKALDKDRGRRYQSAGGFAADVERYLAGEAVQAVPPSSLYRARKFVRRHRSAVVMAVTLGLIGTIGAVSTAGVMVWAAEQRASAAKEQERIAREAADKARILTRMLQELLESADPSAMGGPGYTVVQMLKDYEATLGDKLRDQPEVEADLRRTIGRAFLYLGETVRGIKQFELALNLRRKLHPSDHPKLAEALTDFADSFGDTPSDRYFPWDEVALHRSRARAPAEEAVAILKRINTGPTEEMAWALITNGAVAFMTDLQGPERKQALAAVREGRDIARQCHSDRAKWLFIRATEILANRNEDNAEKIVELKHVLAMRREYRGETHFATAMTHYNLGCAYLDVYDYAAAEGEFRTALRTLHKVFVGGKHIRSSYALRQLVFVLAMQYKDEEAEDELQRACAVWGVEAFQFPLGEQAAYAWGEACHQRGDYAESEAHLLTALAIASAKTGPFSDVVKKETLHRLGGIYANQEKYKAARHVLKDPLSNARAAANGATAAEIPALGMSSTEFHIGVLVMGGVEHPEDLRDCLKLIERFRAELPADADKSERLILGFWEFLARFHLGENDLPYKVMSDFLIDLSLWSPSTWFAAQRHLADALERSNDLAGAAEVYRKAAEYCEKNLSKGHPEVARYRVRRADLLVRQKLHQEAVAEYTEAYKLLAAHPAAAGRSLTRRRAAVVDRLVETYTALGDAKAAGEWRAKRPTGLPAALPTGLPPALPTAPHPREVGR